MRRFSLRYMLLEVMLIALALGVGRRVVADGWLFLSATDLMFFPLCGAAIGGLSGRAKGIVIGAIVGTCTFVLWVIWTTPWD